MDMSVIGFKDDPSVFVVGPSQLNVTTPASATVSEAAPDTFPDTQVIAVVPAPTAVAKPFDPAALLIVAMPEFAELQVTDAVMSCVVLSVNKPIAVNTCEAPMAMEGLLGDTAIDSSVAAVIVSVVDPNILPDNACIVVTPVVTEVADPLDPAALLIVAMPGYDELQVTAFVRSCVELSE